MNIRVDLNYPIKDGTEVVFRSPVDCSQVTGLKVYFPGGSQEFAFADAHGNNVGDIDHLFAENVAVKVILDVTTGMAFVQNADTNAYLEGKFVETIDKCCTSFTESGGIVACEPVEGYPLEVVTHIEPVQAGSGIPSPDNVRPITGWTGAKLWRGSKNLFDESAARVGSNWIYDRTTGYHYFIIDGLKPNTAYTFSFTENGYATNPSQDYYLVATNQADGYGTSHGWFIHPEAYLCANNATIVSSDDGKLFIRAYGVDKNEAKLAEVFNTAKNGMLEHGEYQTEYEPYRGEFFQVDFGQTVYGGSMNWKTGVLTVTWKHLAFNGNEGWYLYSDNLNEYKTFLNTSCFYASLSDKCIGYPNVICNTFRNTNDSSAFTSNIAESGMFTGHPSNTNMYFAWGEVNQTVDEWKAWLAEQYANGTPVEIAYELAEPIHIQLTPQQILALSGRNTLYCDTGDTTVTGRADPTAVIEKLTNAIIALGGNV